MAIIDINSLPTLPWKNSGGVTRNLAVWPENAGLDDFAWRVSVADVQTSGNFSLFPGVDRTILLLSGSGMILHTKDGPSHSLTTPFLPHSFKGEHAIEAQLVDGPSRDFNVMVRPASAQSAVRVWRQNGQLAHPVEAAVFFCARGAFHVESQIIPADHFLKLPAVYSGLRVSPQQADSVLVGAFRKSA